MKGIAMKQPDHTIAGIALATLLLLMSATAFAQESTDSNVPRAVAQKQAAEIAHGDPARWYHADHTKAERLQTLRKEINAGLQEAQGACRKMPAAERSSCLQEARAIYQRDMAAAPAMVSNRQTASNY
jgi:hypothetical protein